jgi:predicted nucleic acid-binding protein
MTESVVLDASVVIAVVTHEPHRARLLQMTMGAELVSPLSLPIEVANAFSAMFKRGRVTLEAAQAAIRAFREIPIRLSAVDLGRSIEISYQLGIYAYDAYLLDCCLQHRSPLLTLDGGLRSAARRLGVEAPEVSP